MSTSFMKALCCTCGSVRECRRPRNHRAENYWLSKPIDLDWHRETGDLKCEECGRITTHALLLPEGDNWRDHAEMMQRVATGNSHGHFKNQQQFDEVATKFRQGFPRNPELNHFRYGSDAQAAWDAGRPTVKALCGEQIPVDRDPSGPASKGRDERRQDDRQIKPAQVRDQEYEDSETGLWWTELDCVDCLRVWHLELLAQRRDVLSGKLTQFLADLLADQEGGYPKKIGLRVVDALIEAFEAINQRSDAVKSEDSNQ
ncbi:hypothetical protein [Mycolicibacterium komossense]|uniref:HNH endonuclease n=1 Tax=Mycolicibacterium komossense TaxID=1779 RepID=A0ABT3CM00_9MYCO|nr:hypothetical protein [Mycolicibacterium komossense]MCV7230426.1 hypothetical protein [Mycolicibacterium komossense]